MSSFSSIREDFLDGFSHRTRLSVRDFEFSVKMSHSSLRDRYVRIPTHIICPYEIKISANDKVYLCKMDGRRRMFVGKLFIQSRCRIGDVVTMTLKDGIYQISVKKN